MFLISSCLRFVRAATSCAADRTHGCPERGGSYPLPEDPEKKSNFRKAQYRNTLRTRGASHGIRRGANTRREKGRALPQLLQREVRRSQRKYTKRESPGGCALGDSRESQRKMYKRVAGGSSPPATRVRMSAVWMRARPTAIARTQRRVPVLAQTRSGPARCA